ncbi:MAG: polymorphic toxin type 44 domain-containing protein [Clostridia bacterium]
MRQRFYTDVLICIETSSYSFKLNGKCSKFICSKDYIEYYENLLFKTKLYNSSYNGHASYFKKIINSLTEEIYKDVKTGVEKDYYISNTNSDNIKNALQGMSNIHISIENSVYSNLSKITLNFPITLTEIKRRFNILDVTNDLNSLMRNNAQTFADHRGDLIYFANNVKTNAKYDLKNSNSKYKNLLYCIYENKLYTGDAPGNISYGYFGKAAGIGDTILLASAGFYQIYSDFISSNDLSGLKRLFSDFGDNYGDQDFIKMGIKKFESDWYLYNYPTVTVGNPVPGPSPSDSGIFNYYNGE